ncbi:MAG: ATP synthase F1 subunit gamma [Campylobacter sp.]|uniref:ATP synthase gamma chain n=1 Tax=Campylobacter gracilis RM3268 TaxID=553220 RepID=C8PEW2_9BACT|nr:ATP synthase F1 subunit gamma [Campylobacter gracilis]RKV92433.1 MAG: F0F1 ATP synthase subunit gamma [Campylobacter sp.]AKT91848.1 ATP synthase, F1 complex, gamma subunit [Campylobacter gracilis]EEV18590.1 ATP synthase F1, gamma subunit [Campylobacter gracilis RM3268]UEB45948.1 F0F1 ATP synthase subunit gamma [Campylobacter gracilis]SUW77701.1 F0F1 ATP synthase subunit gamma [Campylobacter gracilis]
MANLKDIKLQIKSVRNTEKTTKAMKLVSNVKLKNTKEAAMRSRAYAVKINEVLGEISARVKNYVGNNSGNDEKLRIFDTTREVKVVDLLFITADKGLCGGFNINTIKKIKALIEELKAKKIKVRLRAVGKKGIEYFDFQGIELLERYIGVSSSPSSEKANEIVQAAVKDFNEGKTDEVILIHNGYLNMITQEMRVNTLVPIGEPAISEDALKTSTLEVEVESPEDEETLMLNLIQSYLSYSMYYALIDSLAAEHCSRMNAMENATNNAKERVSQLNLAYNKARQGSITTELIEIISGVESMK